jgi:hypothetical protein
VKAHELAKKLLEGPDLTVEVYSDSYYDNSYLDEAVIVDQRNDTIAILMGEDDTLRWARIAKEKEEKEKREEPFLWKNMPPEWGFAVLRKPHFKLKCHKCQKQLEPREEYIYRYSPDIVLHNKKECYEGTVSRPR